MSNQKVLDFLLSAPQPWVRYQALRHLAPSPHPSVDADHKHPSVDADHKHPSVDAGQTHPSADADHQALLADPQVQQLLENCLAWPQPELKRHNDSNHPIHQINLLLDMGLNNNDEAMQQIAEKILAHQGDDDVFLSTLLIPTHFGGSGKPELSWMLCDAPLLTHILIRLGYANDKRVRKSIDKLSSAIRDNGWPCTGAIPKFRGPGKKDDHCPYANLLMLELFSLLPDYHDSEQVTRGLEAIFRHWDSERGEKHYLFGVGSKFRKLKYPLVWYDILHVVDVLSYFEQARTSKQFKAMWKLIQSKADIDGLYTPESIFMAYKGWDFGQKKVASPTLTLAIESIRKRLEP